MWDLGRGWAKPGDHGAETSAPWRARAGGRSSRGRGRGARDPGTEPGGARGGALASPESGARSGTAPCPAQVRPPLPPQPFTRGGGLSPRPRLLPLRRRRRLRAALRPDGQGCAGEWRSERAAAWAGGPRPRLPPPRSWGCTSRRRPISGEKLRPPRPALRSGLTCPGSPTPAPPAHRPREREGGVGMESPSETERPEPPLSLRSRLMAAAYPWCGCLRHSVS